ncbi:MAG: protein translocase subunit SecD [Lachnospiraceae bacterium]|jgi:SecD/SecF fusion protein|nr:protein translocase subunit SecD [Lachnospiraceae bacterium]
MKKWKAALCLGLAVVVIAFLGYVCAFGIGAAGTGSMKNIKLGLDLAGGVSITYQTKDTTPDAEALSDTIYKLQKRVEGYSTEASVYQEGTNRINIEIPGVSDANQILDDLGKPGSLEFQLSDGTVVISGADIVTANATSSTDQTTKQVKYEVAFSLSAEGAEKFGEATSNNIGNTISIVYDGSVISSPVVNSAITDGEGIIEGNFTYDEAAQLASTIRIGSLKLELEELRSNVVGAQLGQQAIRTSLIAGAIGLGLVFLFMIFVYLIPGLASSLALMIYTGLVLLVINAFDVTLTLPGIAGIILSIGMAVDANVIIFARVKEEMTAGKSVRSALKDGFKKALSAIIDGNITTLIAAAVLWFLGSGSVKGFAQTLAIGVVLSMLSALFITRLIVFSLFAVGIQKPKLYYKPLKDRKGIDFVGKKVFFLISVCLLLAGFIIMGVNSASGKGAFSYSLEFVGGTSTTATFDKDYTIDEIDSEISPVVEEATGDHNVQFQKVAGTNQIIIKTVTLELDKREALNAALVDNFGVDESTISAENISSTVSTEMRRDAAVALLVAAVCMLLYIWLRFKDIRFAGSAVLALMHDVLIVVVFYAVSRINLGNTFIAAILTIVGYSINATIVIFDRIREELHVATKKADLKALVNKSINQTLTRSIYTTLTTFITIAVLYIMGVSSVKEFALPLMVGLVFGAYSSVFITGPLWYFMRTKLVKKEAVASKDANKVAASSKKEVTATKEVLETHDENEIAPVSDDKKSEVEKPAKAQSHKNNSGKKKSGNKKGKKKK